jgi:hypothetical protein
MIRSAVIGFDEAATDAPLRSCRRVVCAEEQFNSTWYTLWGYALVI